MATSPAEAPFLSSEGILRLVEVQRDEEYSQGYPLQQLFLRGHPDGRPTLVDSEEFTVETRAENLEIGKFTQAPGSPLTATYERFGREAARVLYQRYQHIIPPNHAVVMREAGDTNRSSSSITAALAMQKAMRHTAGATRGLLNRCTRTLEKLCADLLSQQSFTLTYRDGQQETVNTNITENNSSAPWTTASTDIPADLVRFRKLFRKQAGVDPTDIVFSLDLNDHLATNTKIREWANNNNLSNISGFPAGMLPAGLQGANWIEVGSQYESAPGTKADYWPTLRMTFLALDRPLETLDMCAVPTRSDNYQGGIFAKAFIDERTDDEVVVVGHNGVPVFCNRKKIMQFNLNYTP